MTAMTAPHTMRAAVTFHHSTLAIRGEMTFAFQDATDAMFSDFAGFATQVWDAWVTNMVPAFSAAVVFDGVVLEDIRSIPYGGADFPQTPTAGSGAITSLLVSTGIAWCVKRTTGAVGRSYRGRLYIPVWDQGFISSADTFSSASASAIITGLEDFQADVEGGTYPCTMVLVSFFSDKTPRDPGVATPVTGWSYTDLNLDSQRRRLAGRGR